MGVTEATGPMFTALITGSGQILAALAGKKFRILAADFDGGASGGTIFFESGASASSSSSSGAAGSRLTHTVDLAAHAGRCWGCNTLGYFESGLNEQLSAVVTGTVTGLIRYQVIN